MAQPGVISEPWGVLIRWAGLGWGLAWGLGFALGRGLGFALGRLITPS